MTPGDGTAAAATWAREHADPAVARLGGWARENRASIVVFAAAALVASVRLLSWPSALRQDQWVYTFTAQALAHLHRPTAVAHYTTTTPKPLATLLALVVVPLPPDRGFAAVTIVAFGLLTSATFAYGYRVGGALGAVVAVAALVFLPTLPSALYGGEIDVVAAALVVLSVVSGPRLRVALMTLLGLIRPLAWPLAGVAAFLAAGGSLPRRLLLGALDRVAHGVAYGTGPALFLIGLLGLAVAIARRLWRDDPFPTLVLAGYMAALAVTWMRMPYNARYALPVVVLWPCATAYLASILRQPSRIRGSATLAVVCAITVVAVASAHMSMDPDGVRRAVLTSEMQNSVPAVERALVCGPIDVSPPLVAVEIVAATHRPLLDFGVPPGRLRGANSKILPADVVAMRPRIRRLRHRGWRSQMIPLGWLMTPPGCRAD